MIAWLLALLSVITLRADPRVCPNPCTLTLSIRVTPHPANEAIAVQIEGPNVSTYSEIPITPMRVSVSHKVILTRGGEYEVAAGLIRHDGGTWLAGKASTLVIVQSN